MLKLFRDRRAGGAAGIAVAVALVLASPSVAGELYSWRTDDGSLAFTDDARKIPPRYRERARTQAAARLSGYERYTAKDPEATARYHADLATRLEGLRQLNASLDRRVETEAVPDADVSLRLGNSDIAVPTGNVPGDPVVVETVRVRSSGQMATRHDTVVSQGGRTLLVVKGRQHAENNAALSIEDPIEASR